MCGLKKWVVIEIFQSILWEAIVSCSNMGTAIPSLTLSIQYFLCQLQHGAPPPAPPPRCLEEGWLILETVNYGTA